LRLPLGLALDVQAVELADIPRKKVLGNTKRCQTGPDEITKKPAVTRASVCFHATRCQPMSDAESLPLNYKWPQKNTKN
jgi:hypothetical protein